MHINEAQQDFRRAYVGGSPGVLVSGLVWLAAAITSQGHGVGRGFAVLFIGGMIIHPLSTVLCRKVFGRAKEVAGNPLAGAALESTISMIGGLVAAWLLIPLRAEYVFAVAAIAAGTRYAMFKTIYGDRLFWLLAGLMSGVGVLVIFGAVPSLSPAFAVGGLEVIFAGIFLARNLRSRPLTT
ncbi:DUF7010 family protein [Sphingomonas rubra]|uniref:Uncharacterized protein n=1 Tax=Sphingomonas rubra TaxID=634430 RepID=A0A1I5UX09_9SPHN|nr:hypothetical protein [Sphingomonas rubra]SFP99236.1 hypothetical protein SAMN04488241_1179 [Sphingomonas rubra]